MEHMCEIQCQKQNVESTTFLFTVYQMEGLCWNADLLLWQTAFLVGCSHPFHTLQRISHMRFKPA